MQPLHAQNDEENCVDFLKYSFFSRRSENGLRFHEFSCTSRSTKTEKLVSLPKCATNYNLISGSIKDHFPSPFDNLFKTIGCILYSLYACFIFSVFFIFNKFPVTYACHLCREYDKTKSIPLNKI